MAKHPDYVPCIVLTPEDKVCAEHTSVIEPCFVCETKALAADLRVDWAGCETFDLIRAKLGLPPNGRRSRGDR